MPGVADPEFDVVVLHDERDLQVADEFGRMVETELKFRVWLNTWSSIPGAPGAELSGPAGVDVSVILVGPQTPQGWFRRTAHRELLRQVTNPRYRVLVILLPGAPAGEPEDLARGFDDLRTWVDFRPGLADERPRHVLKHGIEGTAPGPWPPLGPTTLGPTTLGPTTLCPATPGSPDATDRPGVGLEARFHVRTWFIAVKAQIGRFR